MRCGAKYKRFVNLDVITFTRTESNCGEKTDMVSTNRGGSDLCVMGGQSFDNCASLHTSILLDVFTLAVCLKIRSGQRYLGV